ncbi:MAG: response regulator, partial [Acidisphaera sp.]|nr:response regulator [Acidisphaera sp.]
MIGMTLFQTDFDDFDETIARESRPEPLLLDCETTRSLAQFGCAAQDDVPTPDALGSAEPRFSVQQRPQILIAEDDTLFGTTVAEFLGQQGFGVSLVADGQRALEAAFSTDFQVLLTDLRMPLLDGVELIRRLRASRPNLPVVVVTGYAPPDWHEQLQRPGEGPLRMLEKPLRL